MDSTKKSQQNIPQKNKKNNKAKKSTPSPSFFPFQFLFCFFAVSASLNKNN